MPLDKNSEAEAVWLENNCSYDIYWQKLQSMDHKEVCRRSLSAYNKKGFYSLFFLQKEYLVYPEKQKIQCTSGRSGSGDKKLTLLLLIYLLRSSDTPVNNRLISPKALPGGFLFFNGPHSLPAKTIAEHFAEDFPGFKGSAERLGGILSKYGDISYEFQVLPRISMICVLWKGDDEFPSRCDLLLDKSAGYRWI